MASLQVVMRQIVKLLYRAEKTEIFQGRLLAFQNFSICSLASRKRLETYVLQNKQAVKINQHWNSISVNSVPQIDLEQETEEVKINRPSSVDAKDIILNLNEEDTRKLKIIKLEFEVIEQMHGMVPETMTDENWLYALKLANKHQRMNYYRFLFKTENKVKAEKRKRQEKQQKRLEEAAQTQNEAEELEIKSLPRPFIFLRLYDSTIKKSGDYRLAHAMQFGQPLVFDMDYERFMRHQDCQNLVNQLLFVYGKNRDARDPFHLIFTSLDPSGKMFPMLQRAKLTGDNFLGLMTDRSYLDLFPREQLVYLTPHANKELEEVKEDDVYIVGGFNDKSWQKPVSLARAKEQGLRMAKLPLDKYLIWGHGSKCLTVDQVMGILLEQKRTKDWQKAFTAIPKRKLHRED